MVLKLLLGHLDYVLVSTQRCTYTKVLNSSVVLGKSLKLECYT